MLDSYAIAHAILSIFSVQKFIFDMAYVVKHIGYNNLHVNHKQKERRWWW